MHSTVLTALGDKATVTTDKGLQRAEEILLVARDLLIEKGYAGLSMRGIAAQSEVSLSTVQHYYKNPEVLIEALLSYLIDGFQTRIDALIKSMSHKGQQERFEVVLDYLLEECRNPEVCGVFAEAWALAQRLPFASQLMARVEARELKQFYQLIQGLNPAIDQAEYKQRAALIVILLNGLMLQFRVQATSLSQRKSLEQSVREQVMKLAIFAA